MTPERFAEVGAAMFGPNWRHATAEELDVSERNVRRWEKGVPIPPGVIADLAALCRRRGAALFAIADELEA